MLRPIYEQIQRLKDLFNNISFHHVYREKNEVADRFSKDGLQLAPGVWRGLEEVEGISILH